MYTFKQLESVVARINEIAEEKNSPARYQLEPVTGSPDNNCTLWIMNKEADHVVTTNPKSMYTVLYSLRHVLQNL